MSGPVTCAACGAKIKAHRTHCLRCGEPLLTAKREPPEPTRQARVPMSVMMIVAGCLVLGGLAAMLSGGSADETRAQPTPSAPTAASAPRPAPAAAQPQPTSGSPEPVVASLDVRRSGVAAYNQGNLDAAMTEFSNAVEANPDDAEAHNNLGQVLVRRGRAREAITHFDRAIAIAADRWAYHFNRARAYGELKQWPRTIAGYRDAAGLFPEDYATQFNLGKALQANGDLPSAITAYQRAIELAPGQADFHLSLGLAFEAAQRPRDAAAAYKHFLELEPESPQAEKVKARIAMLEGTPPVDTGRGSQASASNPAAAARP